MLSHLLQALYNLVLSYLGSGYWLQFTHGTTVGCFPWESVAHFVSTGRESFVDDPRASNSTSEFYFTWTVAGRTIFTL